jgi:hypothetical protein
MVIFTDFYITYSLKSFFEGSCFELEKSLHKSFKTNARIYTNFDE